MTQKIKVEDLFKPEELEITLGSFHVNSHTYTL